MVYHIFYAALFLISEVVVFSILAMSSGPLWKKILWAAFGLTLGCMGFNNLDYILKALP